VVVVLPLVILGYGGLYFFFTFLFFLSFDYGMNIQFKKSSLGSGSIGSSVGCFQWWRVSGEVSLFSPLPGTCFWVFSAFVFVYFTYLFGTVCLCIA